MNNKKNVIKNLFDPEDYIHLKDKFISKSGEVIFKPKNASVTMLLNGFYGEFVCVNALDLESDGRATLSNISTYRSFVIEEDDTTPDEQKEKIKKSKLPFSNAVFSGNNSIHFTISLEEPLASEEEYRATFRAIKSALSKYGYNADKACQNPNRLTRFPEAFNSKTDALQEVVASAKRVPNKLLYKWLENHGESIENYMTKPYEFTQVDAPDTASNIERWEFVKKLIPECQNYHSLGDGEREPVRFRISLLCKSVGLAESTAIEYIHNEFPSSEGLRKIETEVKKNYKREVKPIRVMSKEDYKALKQQEEAEAKALEYQTGLEELLEIQSSLDQEDVISSDADTELRRYIMVGNDIYFVANRRLYKRTLQTFTIHHRKADLQLIHRYTDFCSEPGYFNYQPVVNNHYNKFELPQWHARTGNWSTIEHYLRHVAGDQYEIILDYFQLSLTNPKQKLPILVLLSYEKNTGKSTFYDLLVALFGNNVVSVTPANFELEWNASWCEKHFIFVDECENLKNKELMGAKLKRLAYFPTIEKNKKGHDTELIPWDGRIVLTSNQASGFLDIDNEEDRYLILNPPPRVGDFDPNYVTKIRSEVPFFAQYLMNRELSTKNENRGWFAKELLHNKALQSIIENSKPQIEIDIETFVAEFFEQADHAGKDEFNFILDDIKAKLKHVYKEADIKNCLHKLYDTTNVRKSAEDSLNGFRKRQKYFFTVRRDQVILTSDVNEKIGESFEKLLNFL